MAEATLTIPSLSGMEIINDLCGVISDKLSTDCNLRPIDGYPGGYKAKVIIHLEAFGLDVSTVDYTVAVDESVKPEDGSEMLPDTVIDTEIEVAPEPDLSEVRRRSGQDTPSFEIAAEVPVASPKRHYTRRLRALESAKSGA